MANMIPMADQMTETEAAASRRPADLPWNAWEPLTVVPADLALLRMETLDGELVATLPDQPARRVSPSFFDGLGGETTFPPQFVAKLSPRLQAEIINERMDATPPREMSIVLNRDTCVRFLPGDRAVIPPRLIADRLYDRLSDLYGGVKIDEATANDGEHWLRFTTPFARTLTGEVVDLAEETERFRRDNPGQHEWVKPGDDILSLGLQVRHEFRDGLSVDLHVKRLLCFNSATTNLRSYSWRIKEDRSEAAQLAWLDDVVASLPDAFNGFLDHARMMAEEKFDGHPRTALQATAKAMKLPKRLLPGLFAAFDQEPGDNHWALFNAVTRAATHGNLSPGVRRDLWNAAGQWCEEFDMVNCRLPKPMAQRFGAQILED